MLWVLLKMRTFGNLFKASYDFLPLENSQVKNYKICWRPTEKASKSFKNVWSREVRKGEPKKIGRLLLGESHPLALKELIILCTGIMPFVGVQRLFSGSILSRVLFCFVFEFLKTRIIIASHQGKNKPFWFFSW